MIFFAPCCLHAIHEVILQGCIIDIPKMMLPLQPEKFGYAPHAFKALAVNNYSTTTTLFQYSHVSKWYYLHYLFNYSTI